MSGRALLRRATHQVANPSTTRRVVADFFSILVTTTAPISAVLATCVPPQGWKSIIAVSPIRPASAVAVPILIVRMLPLPVVAGASAIEPALLSELVRVAFSQRRKLLRHILGRWLTERGFAGGFDVQRRAEEVPVADYLALAAAVAAHK